MPFQHLQRSAHDRPVDGGAAGAERDQGTATSPREDTLLVRLPGRLLLQGVHETQCTLVSVRGRTAYVTLNEVGGQMDGGRIVLYLDLIGRIEGSATWSSSTAIDVHITAPDAKWVRLAQQFKMLARMPSEERENLRGHRRIQLDVPEIEISVAESEVMSARIIDVSRSGAAVETAVVPPLGTLVTLGSTRGRVVRILDGGFAVQFARLLPLELFGVGYQL